MKTATALDWISLGRCKEAARELVIAMNPQPRGKIWPRDVNHWPSWAIRDWDLAFDALTKAARGES